MSKSKASPTPEPWYHDFIPREGIKVWLAKIALGVLVLSIWSPIGTLLGLPSAVITVSFIVAFTVFFSTSAGTATERVLDRMIRREG